MIGKLDPEEHVMENTEYFAWREGGVMDSIQEQIRTLGWDANDDIAVEIGGTSVYEIDGAGTKWAPIQGTRKYNKDAFIVIKNKSRNPTVSSKSEKQQLADKKVCDDKNNFETYSK